MTRHYAFVTVWGPRAAEVTRGPGCEQGVIGAAGAAVFSGPQYSGSRNRMPRENSHLCGGR